MIRIRRFVGDVWRNWWLWLGNWVRGLGRRPPYFVHLRIDGSLPEHVTPQPRWQRFGALIGLRFSAPGVSLSGLRRAFERIGADPQALDVVLQLDGMQTSWSKAQSLRQALQGFKDAGKRVVAYSSDFDNLKYYVACAADQIVAPPSAGWNVIGLQVSAFYLREALRSVHVSADVVAVSPYKTAGDFLTRGDMSDQERENIDEILQAYYDELIAAITAARGLDEKDVRAMIDRAPLLIEEALDQGLLDHVRYLDEVEHHVLRPASENPKARLLAFSAVARRLPRPIRWRSGKAIGVIALEGTIVAGTSRRVPLPLPLPFLNPQQAGSDSVSAALRSAERDPSIAAVVLYVNSPGGSSLASDSIWREATRVARKKPLVVYMDGIAASGGYYVSTHAHWIVCQKLTQTGSIGVVWIKLILNELIDWLRIGRVSLRKGAHAGIFSDVDQLDPEQMAVIENYIFGLYDQFKQRVSEGRRLSAEGLDQVSGGRVWVGSQALGQGLVDELGDFECAVRKAKELAGLPGDRWSPTIWITPQSLNLLPEAVSSGPEEWRRWIEPYQAAQTWFVSPFDLKIE